MLYVYAIVGKQFSCLSSEHAVATVTEDDRCLICRQVPERLHDFFGAHLLGRDIDGAIEMRRIIVFFVSEVDKDLAQVS